MRIPIPLLVALAVLASTASGQPAPPVSAPGEALFVISGRGYGHGVGMSQYGAFGMAKGGASYDEILAHYYTGTTLGRARTKEVRVLLAEGRRAVTIVSPGPFTLVDATGKTYRMANGPLTLRPGLVVPTAVGSMEAASPLVVRPGKGGQLSLDGRPYRGRLEIVSQGGFLRVVNHVALEAYLQGVVAGEVPHSWPAEALKAQAVAARSYALATLVKGKPFDLYADVRSQVYLGVAGEQESTTQAVRTTRGQVVLYGGKIATTYYFSTSGGKTASAADVFGFTVPYLVSRPDPWDKASPYHRWGPVLVGARTLQSKLEVDGRVLDVTGAPTPSGRLRSVAVQTAGGSTTIPAGALRTTLDLRSTWMTIGVLRLDQPRAPVLFGSNVRLVGLARGMPSPTISSSVSGSLWAPVGAVERGARGAASLVVKPQRTTRYRIEVAGASSPAMLVRVAPRVQLGVSEEPGVLVGTVRPRLASAPVTIERRNGTTWMPVAKAIVAENGAFRVELDAVAGSYRARIPATNGFVEGVGPVQTVKPLAVARSSPR
ncbi:MAG TPA: SpoIID/LytB domain-containing protein [Gaiellaceae bacterium]|nr:SpoIID/LytB domain-containing protein [Gaiellaceae bacterium]